MAKLNSGKLQAATLLETLVAFVIVVTVFTISLALINQVVSTFYKSSGLSSGSYLLTSAWAEQFEGNVFSAQTIKYVGLRVDTDTIESICPAFLYQIEFTATNGTGHEFRHLRLLRFKPDNKNIDPLEP